MSSDPRRPHARFELAHDLPFPVSVGERDGEVVVLLQDGAVVDAGVVSVLNDLLARRRVVGRRGPELRIMIVGIGTWGAHVQLMSRRRRS